VVSWELVEQSNHERFNRSPRQTQGERLSLWLMTENLSLATYGEIQTRVRMPVTQCLPLPIRLTVSYFLGSRFIQS
jgi:hypothetical protein